MMFGDWVHLRNGRINNYGVVVDVLPNDCVAVTWEVPRRTEDGPKLTTTERASDLERVPGDLPKRLLQDEYFTELATDTIALGLNVLAAVEAQVQVLGGDASALAPTRETVAMFALALISEVNETASELTWKRWKKGAQPNPQRAMEESADILAFLGLFLNWLQYYDITMEQLAREFVRKSLVNIERLNGRVPEYGVVQGQ